MQASPDVVKLKRPDRDEGKDFHVDARSYRRGDRSARPETKKTTTRECILRFPGGPYENMSKGGDFCRKRDLRADQKGMDASARSIQSAVLTGEIPDSAEETYRLVLERQIPSVQVHLLWNRRRG